jgi:hypothetical protein
MATDATRDTRVPEATEVSSSPVARLLVLIWVRPRLAFEQVAAGPGWLWAVPLGAAVLLVYARFLVAIALLSASSAMAILVGGLAGVTLGWLLRAFILWKTSDMLGGQTSFAGLYRLSAWAAFPLILREAVRVASTLATGMAPDEQGLASLAPQPVQTLAQAAGNAILSRIDLYSLWFILLLFLAVRIGTSLSRTRTALVVGCYCLVALLPLFAERLLSAMFG